MAVERKEAVEGTVTRARYAVTWYGFMVTTTAKWERGNGKLIHNTMITGKNNFLFFLDFVLVLLKKHDAKPPRPDDINVVPCSFPMRDIDAVLFPSLQ